MGETVRTVLMTGAAGDVAARLRPMLRERYDRVILSDRIEPPALAPNEAFRGGDLNDAAAMAAACDGVDGLVHLGGQPAEAPWEVIDASDIRGVMTLMEAARRAGARRVVYASSNHAIGMYPRTARTGPEDRVRPDARHGLKQGVRRSALRVPCRQARDALLVDPHRQRHREAR